MPNTHDTARGYVLERAAEIVHGDRNETNGDPGPQFARLAALFSAYLGIEIGPQDVAALMMLLKICRLGTSPTDLDHWVDLVGYAACGYEAVDHWLDQGGVIQPSRAQREA